MNGRRQLKPKETRLTAAAAVAAAAETGDRLLNKLSPYKLYLYKGDCLLMNYLYEGALSALFSSFVFINILLFIFFFMFVCVSVCCLFIFAQECLSCVS